MKSIGKELMKMRKMLGLSRSDVVKATGISLTGMDSIENETTKIVKNINSVYDFLQNSLKKEGIYMNNIDGMQQIKMKEDYLPTISESLRTLGFSYNDTNTVLAMETANKYYDIFFLSAQNYIDEYDEQFHLKNILRNQRLDERVIAHEIAIEFTYKLLKMVQVMVQEKAQKENIDVNDVVVNKMIIIQWAEVLAQELDSYISNRFAKWRPGEGLSEEYLTKLREYMQDVE